MKPLPTYIYMNEHIREKSPKRPVIVVQRDGRLKVSNKVTLRLAGRVVARVKFVKSGLRAATRNHVRAFVEVMDDVEVTT